MKTQNHTSKIIAWSMTDGAIVHPKCRKNYKPAHMIDAEPTAAIHDMRSDYISRFQICAQCKKAI